MPKPIRPVRWFERSDNAVLDYHGRTFMVAFEPDTTGITPETCDWPAANNAARRASWKRGEWHYVTVRVTAVDRDLKPLLLTGVETTRHCLGVPSTGDLYRIAERLCSEIIYNINTAPGGPPG